MGFQSFGYYASRDKSAYWDGKTETREQVSSGTYFYQIHARLKSQAGDYTETRKMVILKQMKNRIQSYLLLLISTLLLGTGFLNNQFKVAEQKWFQNHQQDTESLVIGRMVKAKRDGIFSAGGLTGQVSGIQQIATDKLQWSGPAVSSQYQAYYNDLDFTSFNPYFSQIGFQAISFSFIDKILPLSPPHYITVLKVLNAYSFAFVLSLII